MCSVEAAPPSHPRLRCSVNVLAQDDGRLAVTAGQGRRVVLRDEDGRLTRLLGLLDGETALDGIGERLGAPQEDAERAVGELERLGLLEDADAEIPVGMDPSYLDRFDRQIALFADLETAELNRYEMQKRLQSSHVVQLGLGGIGSWCALGLAATGIGRLTGIDFDRIELSNLNRQILYGPADIGREKTEVAAEALKRFNPALQVDTVSLRIDSPEVIAPYLEDADFVISTVDRPTGEIHQIVNEALRRTNTPATYASHMLPLAGVGPLVVPGLAGCFECVDRMLRRDNPLYMAVDARARFERYPLSTGPASCAIAGIAVRQATRYLANRTRDLHGSLLILNTYTFEAQRLTPTEADYCSRCADLDDAADRSAA